MPYLLGVISDEDILEGVYKPTYVLHFQNGKSKRIQLRVCKNRILRQSVLIFNSMEDNEQYINFMSNIRTRNEAYDKEHRSGTDLKKRITGWLCWLSCDRYGKTTGHIVIIKHVPDVIYTNGLDKRSQKFIQFMKQKLKPNRFLSKPSDAIDAMPWFKKKKYPQ